MNENISRLEQQLQEVQDSIERIDLMTDLSKEVCWTDARRALALADQAEALAAGQGYELGVYLSRHCRGRALVQLSEFEKGLNYLIPCVEYYQRIGDRRELLARQSVGAAYHQLGELRLAFASWSTCLKLARAGDDRKALAECLLNMGVAYQSLGDFGPAVEYGLESLEILENLGDVRALLFCYLQLASTYGGLCNYDKTLEFFQRGLALGGAAHDTHAHALLLGNISLVYVIREDHENAIKWLGQSLAFQVNVGDRPGESITLTALGREYLRTGDPERALHYLLEGVRIAREIGLRFQEAAIHLELGDLYLQGEDYESSLRHLGEAISLARISDARAILSDAHRRSALLYERKRNFQQALEHYRKHFELEREFFGAEVQRHVASLQKRHELRVSLGKGEEALQVEEIAGPLAEMRALNHALVLLSLWLVREDRKSSELVAQNTHDLRAPVTAIQINVSFLKMLMRDEPADHLHLALDQIELSARRMAAIINGLLDLSVLDAGRLRFLAQTLDLGAIAKEVTQHSVAEAQARQVSLELRPDTQPVYVLADQVTMTRVLGELVSNVIRSSPAGAGVSIRVGSAPGFAWCEILAEGAGQNAGGPPAVFQRLNRLGSTPGGGEPSSLGLAIVKRLVEAMGGSFSVNGGERGGSAFLLQLPLSTSILTGEHWEASEEWESASPRRPLFDIS